MSDPRLVGHVQDRPPAVDFIDRRLPQYHPAFLDAPSAFDHRSGRYIPLTKASFNGIPINPIAADSMLRPPIGPSPPPPVSAQAPQDVAVQSMRFWNDIFPEAMKQFLSSSEEPKSFAKSGGGIRKATSWDEICARLDEVKSSYIDGEGAPGIFKRARRKVAENLGQPASHIAKMVPDIDPWTTPVVGTFGILLQAMNTAAKTRLEVLNSLEDLEETFSNINSFAATFPKDQQVRQASIYLVVAIFEAVERAMGFFAKSAGRKAAEAVLSGTDYQKDVLNSFGKIQKLSGVLIQQAQNSHYEGTRSAMLELLSGSDHMKSLLSELLTEQAQQSADTKNTIKFMLEGYARVYELDRWQQREEQRQRDEAQKQRDAIQRREHQELLAVVHHFQVQQMNHRPVSPLPTMLALATPPTPSSCAVANQISPTWTVQRILQIVGLPNMSALDITRVKDLDSTLSHRDKKKADQVLQTECFGQWLKALRPSKLLIHGVFRRSRTISPLSLLTATLIEAARADQHRFVSMVFFCGCHLDTDEDPFCGGRAIVKMLLSQLLQQQPYINTTLSPWEVDIGRVQQGDLEQLCRLLNILVHRLPAEVTLFCLIDGMAYYEREEFIDEMQYVLIELLRLVGDPSIHANVKLLITSPWKTDMTQRFFHEEGEIIHMDGMPSVELTPSASRIIDRYIPSMESDNSSTERSSELADSPSRR